MSKNGQRSYDRFVWFTKYGDFSHAMKGFDKETTPKYAEMCLSGKKDFDWHYDIIAMHQTSKISMESLAEGAIVCPEKEFQRLTMAERRGM